MQAQKERRARGGGEAVRWSSCTSSRNRRFSVRNAGISARTRHYELWQQFVRELYMKLVLSVHLTPTDLLVADIFTKAMPKDETLYEVFRNYIMNVPTK